MSDWNETVQQLNEVGNLRSEITRLRAALATARKEERERCAKVADKIASDSAAERNLCALMKNYSAANHWNAHRDGCAESAAAIRAMKDDINE